MRFSRLGDFDNQYYTATVVSMLQSPTNFLFGSFDPGGVVMVDALVERRRNATPMPRPN